MTLDQRRVLVTGVSSGLGLETARSLAARGALVVGTVRDRTLAGSEEGGLSLVELDLASLASVRDCADALLADGRSFDLVIANAGVMSTPQGRTRDGFETQFGVNHLGRKVEGAVVQKNCAEDRTFGFEVMRKRAFGDGEIRHRLSGGKATV